LLQAIFSVAIAIVLLVTLGTLSFEQRVGVTCFCCCVLNQAELGVYQRTFKDTDLYDLRDSTSVSALTLIK